MAEWIEIIFVLWLRISVPLSPLAMAEWIEIQLGSMAREGTFVSASDGGVD